MTNSPEQATLGKKIGGGLMGLSIVFCSTEMVPAWQTFHLDWSPMVYLFIMAASGAVSGILMAEQHRLPGLVGGMLAGPGALLAIALVLEHSTWTHTVIILVVGGIGAIPGLLLYGALAGVENAVASPGKEETPDERLDDPPAE